MIFISYMSNVVAIVGWFGFLVFESSLHPVSVFYFFSRRFSLEICSHVEHWKTLVPSHQMECEKNIIKNLYFMSSSDKLSIFPLNAAACLINRWKIFTLLQWKMEKIFLFTRERFDSFKRPPIWCMRWNVLIFPTTKCLRNPRPSRLKLETLKAWNAIQFQFQLLFLFFFNVT